MKEVYYKSRKEAQEAIDKHIIKHEQKRAKEKQKEEHDVYDMFSPQHFYVFPEGDLEIELWRGLRRFKGCDWVGYSYIAANKDHTVIHLSEYWGDDEAGFYKKVK